MFDCCVNLADASFASDRAELVARAVDNGVRGMLLTACDLESSRACIKLCAELAHLNCLLRSSVGYHPHQAKEWHGDAYQQLAELGANSSVAIVGECGLDYYRDLSDRRVQKLVFEKQLELASDKNLPILLHEREASADLLAMLNRLSAACGDHARYFV